MNFLHVPQYGTPFRFLCFVEHSIISHTSLEDSTDVGGAAFLGTGAGAFPNKQKETKRKREGKKRRRKGKGNGRWGVGGGRQEDGGQSTDQIANGEPREKHAIAQNHDASSLYIQL